MATLVLLILALAWGGVLVWWIRSRSDGSLIDSIGMFSRDLNMLRRATPGNLRPAYVSSGIQSIVPRNQASSASYLYNHAYSSQGLGAAGTLASGGYGSQQLTSNSERVAMARRRRTQRRRRDVLFIMIAVTLAVFLIAVVTGKGSLIALQVVCDLALAGYVGMLVRANQERLYRRAIQSNGYNYQITPRTRTTTYAGGRTLQTDPSYGGQAYNAQDPAAGGQISGDYYDQAFGSYNSQAGGYPEGAYTSDQAQSEAPGYYDEQGYWVDITPQSSGYPVDQGYQQLYYPDGSPAYQDDYRGQSGPGFSR